uniref:Peptidase M50, putative membrane-associated zinc metallopeptidase n=1 Tax=Paulinella chromatophora TaxID=39717 RepID=B1X3K1_PAUCH|nr:Peptidase M50, putative membrane-associated zinc metallopeptidase [Paulinella chromatophora]ACB42520.1 Peptidase M50, putative membrane-associated zinc metallopeptidase [Paulinella chromatophora]
MSILSVIIILLGLIIVHEAGHFLVAILQKIRVYGFSVGFGPAILKKQHNGVTFALRLIPLGGFVSFPDVEVSRLIPSDDPDLLFNRPLLHRSLVIVAGVFANISLAWIVLISQVLLIGLPNIPDPGILITAVQPGQPAYLAGLQSGDLITSINGHALSVGEQAVNDFVQYVKSSPKEHIELILLHDNSCNEVAVEPNNIDGFGHIGIQLQANFTSTSTPPKSPGQIFRYANVNLTQMIRHTIFSYSELLTNFNSAISQLSGPIKIVETGSLMLKQGGTSVFQFTALISINLAVLNAFPFPLLDGGQLLLLFIERLRGQPLSKKIENIFIQTGIFILVGLTFTLLVHDILHLNVIRRLFE